MNEQRPLFPWSGQGVNGLRVSSFDREIVVSDFFAEEQAEDVGRQGVFMGPAIPRRRLVSALAACAIGILFFIGRAFWLQVVEGSTYQTLAENNRLRREIIPAARGIIRDHTGVILAANAPSFNLSILPEFLSPSTAIREEELATIGRGLGMTVTEIEAALAESRDPQELVLLRRDVPYEQASMLYILATRIPAIHVVAATKRSYPLSARIPSLSHVLGYIGSITAEELPDRRAEGYRRNDMVGKTGIEAQYETRLRGRSGEDVYEVDARNQKTRPVGHEDSIDGGDLQLTIDSRLQEAVEAALRDGLESAEVTRGTAIALDPRSGEIRALVSLPAYDNNLFSGTVSSTQYRALIDNPDHPLLARAWSGVYPSGSTLKPVMAVAALAEGVISPQTSIVSVGGLHVGPWFFPDWKPGGHGTVNVRSAIAWSVNTFFYVIGGGYQSFTGLGVDRMTDWFGRFGLGRMTGLDLPGENDGFVPSQTWKEETKHERWYIGDTYNLSIGQGDLLVTPIQVAAFTAAIANGGFKITPHLLGDASSTIMFPVSSTRIAPAPTIATVQAGMRDTVAYGSGSALKNVPFSVAGKTGTAQWRSDRKNHAWFTGFAPFERPEIVVTVLLEEGDEGSRTAVPVAKRILEAWSGFRSQTIER